MIVVQLDEIFLINPLLIIIYICT